MGILSENFSYYYLVLQNKHQNDYNLIEQLLSRFHI